MTWLLAGMSGLLLVLLFPSFNITLLAPIALAPLLIAIAREKRPMRRAIAGEICGFLFWIGMCYWIRPVLEAYGGLTPGLSWLALILFALVKAVHMAVFAWLSGHVIHRSWAIPALAALWVGIERTHGTFGFAWLILGNAGTEMSIPARLAPLVGGYGLSFVFVMLNAALALLLIRRPRIHLLPVAALAVLPLMPALPNRVEGTLEAAVLQPDLSEGRAFHLEELAGLARIWAFNQPALLALPEVPAGFYWDADPVFRRTMENLARETATPLLFGAVTHNAAQAPLNSAILLDRAAREQGRYSKTFLVPFGEFIPPLFGWINKISTEAGNFAPGDGPRVMAVNDLRLGTFICYESAFPHLVRSFTAAGANVLVNLSNDGWFFRTAAREQHLLLARMRASENGRWLLRITNNGITAAIDPAGRVMADLPQFRLLAGRLSFSRVDELTLYARTGDVFAWVCLGAGLLLAALGAVLPQRVVE